MVVVVATCRLLGLFLALASGVLAQTDPHDCRTKELWSPEKKDWCCKNKNAGCPASPATTTRAQDAHNCRSREKWSVEKTKWCCTNKNVGCPPPPSDPYNCRSRESWPADKKEWCCANKNAGCPPSKPDAAPTGADDKGLADTKTAAAKTNMAAEVASAQRKQPKNLRPRMLSVFETTSESATLVWVAPALPATAEDDEVAGAACESSDYQVLFRKFTPPGTKKKKWLKARRPVASDPVQTIVDLQPATVYQVRVKVVGGGKPVMRRFRTKPAK